MTTAELSPAPIAPPKSGRFQFRPFRNPVVLKELRGRMRGMRAFVVLTVYLALMSGFVTLLYVLYSSSLSYYGYASGGQIGRVLFIGIVGTELFLVTFIAPTFTAGAISGERERQTYDLLRTTLLPARSLVIGKLVSALSYVFILLLAAIPLQSIAFLFGGVTETEVILAFIILVVTAIALGSVGIYFSAIMQRTLTASIMTYGFALFVTLGLPLIVFVIVSLLGPVLFTLSPSPGVQTALFYGLGAMVSTNPLATALTTEILLVNNQTVGYFQQPIAGTGWSQQLPAVSPWIVFTILYLIVSFVLVLLAIRRVKRIETT
jgi:ABC-type transport system involved in multi-copper enzyme maturation permease subunit